MIKFGQSLTQEQFDKIWFNGKWNTISTPELTILLEVYKELTGESPCVDCAESVQTAKDELKSLRDAFENAQNEKKRLEILCTQPLHPQDKKTGKFVKKIK